MFQSALGRREEECISTIQSHKKCQLLSYYELKKLDGVSSGWIKGEICGKLYLAL